MREYTTERGVTVGIMPIPLLLEKVREAYANIKPLTYVEHIAGGSTMEVEITPAMADVWAKENPDGWEEYAGEWAEYQEEVDKRTKALNEALWRAVLRRAIVVDVPKDDGWIEEQRDLGINVPEGKTERREHYIWTEVIGGQRDIIRIMAMAAGTDLTEDQLSAVEASFWDTLQRPSTR